MTDIDILQIDFYKSIKDFKYSEKDFYTVCKSNKNLLIVPIEDYIDDNDKFIPKNLELDFGCSILFYITFDTIGDGSIPYLISEFGFTDFINDYLNIVVELFNSSSNVISQLESKNFFSEKLIFSLHHSRDYYGEYDLDIEYLTLLKDLINKNISK